MDKVKDQDSGRTRRPTPVAAVDTAVRVLDGIGEAVFALDLSGRCIYANRSALRLLDLQSFQDIAGRHLHEVLHGRLDGVAAAHSAEDCPLTRALSRGSATHITHETFHKLDGTTIEVECRAYPLASAGANIGAAVTCVDVSSHQQAREEELFRRVLLDAQTEASIDGILVVSKDTKMLSFNRRFIDLWGVPRHIVDSRSDELALSWVLQKLEDPQAFTSKVAYLYEHPDEESRDLIRLKDGRTFDRYSAPVRSREGVYYGRVWFFRDVSDLKDAERELARLYEEARQAVRMRDDFLSIASHELRTPLTSLQLQAQSLIRRLEKPEFRSTPAWVSERAKGVQDLVTRLSTLIENLLDISRITAGRLVLDPEEVDLSELVGSVLGRHEEQLTEAGCTVSLHAAGPVVGRWDRSRVDQVITNLLTNASKYGAGKPVEVTVTGDDSCARLAVRDHGIGIEPADRQRIFMRFERAVSAANYSGFGLGLWICLEIVKAMDGTIDVSGTPGEGSTFTVTLPLRAAPETESIADRAAAADCGSKV